jgi:hypothetical protein
MIAARDLSGGDFVDRHKPPVTIPGNTMLAASSPHLLPTTRAAVARCCPPHAADPCDKFLKIATAIAMELDAGAQSHYAPMLDFIKKEKFAGAKGPYTMVAYATVSVSACVCILRSLQTGRRAGVSRARWCRSMRNVRDLLFFEHACA